MMRCETGRGRTAINHPPSPRVSREREGEVLGGRCELLWRKFVEYLMVLFYSMYA